MSEKTTDKTNKTMNATNQGKPGQQSQPRPAQQAAQPQQGPQPQQGRRPQQGPRPGVPPRRPIAPGMAPPAGQPGPKQFSPKMDDAKIKEYLQKIKPRRTFRGINDEDMWTIVANVQKFYQKEYDMQVARFQAILEEKDREIYNLRMEKK